MAHHNYRNLVLVVAIVALGTVLWWAVRHQQHVTPEPLTGEHRAVAYQTPPVKPGATPLEVVFKSPAGPEYSTEGAPTIVATFSQAMVPLGEVTQDGGLKALQISPPLPGRYRWIGTRTCTFIPEHLPYATHFTVTVPAGLVSQEGSTLPQAVTWTFDTTRPSLVANFPSDDHAEPKAAIYLRFDQPVRAGDVHPTISPTTPVHIRQATPDDVNTLGQAGWGVLDATDIVVLQPDQPLPLGTQFTVTIPKGTMGAQGDLGTDSDGTATFSTYSALKFDAADCGKTMDPGDGVSFRFNNAIKPADLFKHLKVDPAPPGPAPADDEESPSVYLALGWKCNTTYHYTIDGDLADTYGQKLGQSVTGTFTTGHLTRSLTFKTGLWSLESRLPHAVPVGVVNIKSL
ncbi:MAG TPA: Ig-like domain-containing protein, partial [Candidatus Xenobia bacterium]